MLQRDAAEISGVRFFTADEMVEWFVQRATCYPDEVEVRVAGEEIAVKVVLEDGTSLVSGFFGEGYPPDFNLGTLPGILFNQLTVAIALKRMRTIRSSEVSKGEGKAN